MTAIRDALAEVILAEHEPGFANVQSSKARDALLQQFREAADAVLGSGHVVPTEDVVQMKAENDQLRAVLDLESTWFKYAGRKESVIRERFDMSTTRYYQVLRGLLQREEAMAYDPLLVRRLIRQQKSRARSRSAKRLPR